MKIRVVETIEEFKRHFGLGRDGILLEPDLDEIETDCDVDFRKRRDAEVLCTLAANSTTPVLELGTSHGRGAYKLATNVAPGLTVFTVNLLPEQYDTSGGKMITHLMSQDMIGAYYRERGISNVEQIYANTARWDMPERLNNLGLVFVDAAHDEALVASDTNLVWPRVAENGFIVWHDFTPFLRKKHDWIDASMRGVERLLREQGLADAEVVYLKNSWCGVFRKETVRQAVTPGVNPARPRVEVLDKAVGGERMNLRYAVVYPAYSAARMEEDELFAAEARKLGYDVEALPIVCPGGWWHFPKLDEKWRTRSSDLIPQYEALEERLRSKDVLISSGGPMLHPEFVRRLSTFNVWICGDDPESSEVLSRPAAPAFDYCLPINIACINDYKRWGCERVDWIFHPVRPELSAPELTESKILDGRRDIDAVMFCERILGLSDRAQRLDRLEKAFPQAFLRGKGWPGGFISDAAMRETYRRAKIGWNLHNSIGPCNTRLTTLPAFGVMQICDNKQNLGKVFELDREVAGFDSIEECIDKTRYYLEHDAERRQIAAAGWARVMRDYTLAKWWERLTLTIAPHAVEKLIKLGKPARTAAASVASRSSVGSPPPGRRLSPEDAIQAVLGASLTYCSHGGKLKRIAEAVVEVASRNVDGIYLEAGVALGGSAIVIGSAKPRDSRLKLYDVFDLLPAPGANDEPRAHAVYQQFLDGQRTAPIDRNYLAGVAAGMKGTVQQNLAAHGITLAEDHVEMIAGDFKDTLFVDEPIAFAHIDCDGYDAIKVCLERLSDRVSPGGLLVFDDYASFSGARKAIDEWLAGDRRFRLRSMGEEGENVVVERLLETAAPVRGPNLDLPVLAPDGSKPRVLMLVDKRGWAYDTAAQAISKRLADEFEFRIEYVREQPDLSAWPFDLIYVFFWGETYHQKFVQDPSRVIKEISSHRWANEEQYGRLTSEQAAQRYLSDAGTLTATSHRLRDIFSAHRDVHWCPNGFEQAQFQAPARRTGPLRIGWAGNENDPCKGLKDVLQPAVGRDFELVTAGGDLGVAQMGEFYNQIDVLCVASTAEGEPLTLVEGMASGCFPVSVDVGIVPELVRHGRNGLMVNRTPSAFQSAFQWCRLNVGAVRRAGAENARTMLTSRRWDDVSIHWRRALRSAYRRYSATRPDHGDPSIASAAGAKEFFERNLGVQLGQWPERAQAAAALLARQGLGAGHSVIDLGCGHQTLKPLLPAGVKYVPVDRIARTPEVTVVDFNERLPEGKYTSAALLGVIEYFDRPERLLRWAAENCQYLVLSYNDCSNPARREKQHWRSTLSFEQLESTLAKLGGRILERHNLGRAELIYSISFADRPVRRIKKLALFSAAVNGDNSGDALIVDAIQRLLSPQATEIFPLLEPLTSLQIDRINACDMAVICGTNLYQHDFHCALTPAIVSQIRVPIFPLGIGTSAPIGQLPRMDAEGIRTVRMIHERCVVGSVRDPISLKFVQSLGISNVALTGCPVLFHALREPVFETASTDRLVVAVRARLLHVEEHWGAKQYQTLERLCREFRPTLVLQSPYDVPIAEDLSSRFRVPVLHDAAYTAKPMIEGVQKASRTIGFRLHFGMLTLAYGKPATLIATDTRTSEFCQMMGVAWHDIHSYTDELLIKELHEEQPGRGTFSLRWRELRDAMKGVLQAAGLETALE